MLFFTIKIPSPPITRSSAERDVSASFFASGSNGFPLSMNSMVTCSGSRSIVHTTVAVPISGLCA